MRTAGCEYLHKPLGSHLFDFPLLFCLVLKGWGEVRYAIVPLSCPLLPKLFVQIAKSSRKWKRVSSVGSLTLISDLLMKQDSFPCNRSFPTYVNAAWASAVACLNSFHGGGLGHPLIPFCLKWNSSHPLFTSNIKLF